MSQETFHILIIGAGVTGLAMAQGLEYLRKTTGYKITYSIFDRQDQNTHAGRQRNWAFALHWGEDYLQSFIDPELYQNLNLAQADPSVRFRTEDEATHALVNGKTGDTLVSLPAIDVRRVSKEKLRRLLSTDIAVQYGKRLLEIECENRRVVAKFDDGTSAFGDALVGADSGSSRVRRFLLGDEQAALETVPVELYNFECQFSAEKALQIRTNMQHATFTTSIHPDQHTFSKLEYTDVPDLEHPETWKMQMLLTRNGKTPASMTPAERLSRFKELALNHCEPVCSIANWIDDENIVYNDKISHWPNITQWPSFGGRVTLAGDAAHCMVPFGAEGVNNCLQDIAMYIRAIRKLFDEAELNIQPFDSLIERVIDEYDAEILERGKRAIKSSADRIEVMHSTGSFLHEPRVRGHKSADEK